MNGGNFFNVKTVGSFFFIILLALIFSSKTIYTYNLPVVTATSPKNGKLSKLELTNGLVGWADIVEEYAELGAKVEEIHADEGDVVEKGQPIIRFSFDEDDVRKKLEESGVSRSKLAVDIENIGLKIEKTRRNIAELENEVYEADSVSTFELRQLESDIAKAVSDYEKIKLLRDAGGATDQELYNAEYNISSLQSKHENLLQTMEENREKSDKAIQDKEKNRQKLLADYAYELDMYQQDLKTKNLDLDNLAIQEASYRKTLADYGRNLTIYAPQDGTVISLPVKTGQRVNQNQLLFSLGVGSGFKIECSVSLDNNFVTTGDTCKINNSSHTLDAVVTKIEPTERVKKITLLLSSDEVSAGETFEIRFEKTSATSYTLVPNGAVNRDSDGYFLYQIKRRDGILGKEFYCAKQRIYIGDSDNEYTEIIKGVSFFEPIVLLSDKPFSENDTIKIKNESDFFAD